MGDSSILQINCENVQKAQLVQAKYLSDLSVLPGVNEVVLSRNISAREISGQGAVAAIRSGAMVQVFASPTRAALTRLLASHLKGDMSTHVSRPQVEVPMYLNRWDTFGFRFYYREWETPPNLNDAQRQAYDITQEFEWAKKQERSGFVFWDTQLATDTAQGLMNETWFDWAARAARRNDLPVAINTSRAAARQQRG